MAPPALATPVQPTLLHIRWCHELGLTAPLWYIPESGVFGLLQNYVHVYEATPLLVCREEKHENLTLLSHLFFLGIAPNCKKQIFLSMPLFIYWSFLLP